MNELEIMIGVTVAGFILLVSGFALCERELGVWLVAVGIAAMLGIVGYQIHSVLS